MWTHSRCELLGWTNRSCQLVESGDSSNLEKKETFLFVCFQFEQIMLGEEKGNKKGMFVYEILHLNFLLDIHMDK